MRKIRLKKQSKKFDKNLFILAILLTVLGLVAVADASAPIALSTFSDEFYFLKQQAVWGVLGLILLAVISRIHYSFWEKFAVPIFIASTVTLILVLIPQLGVSLLGARRWLVFGPISFQPSEFAKLALALYLAKVASKNKVLLSYLVPIGLFAGLIMMQPDLGTTVVVSTIGLVQMFVAGLPLLNLVGVVSAGGILSFVLIITSDYRRDRLLTFFEQTQDPLGRGYHIRQILFALGSGGLLGVGLGQSRQKYLFLPEAATDSIFAVIAEEVGFVGASILILMFAYFVYRGLAVVRKAPDKFSQILSAGIVTWIGGQAWLNVAAQVAIVPVTGIPLPFFSYGGSSLTAVLGATGILLNISRYVQEQGQKRKR